MFENIINITQLSLSDFKYIFEVFYSHEFKTTSGINQLFLFFSKKI
jgi:hypothetical protein